MTPRRTAVVVTGTGIVLPGIRDAAGLLTARHGDADGRVGPERLPSGRQARFKDRATLLALSAGEAALTDAGLLVDGSLTVPGSTTGTVASSNLGSLETVCRAAETVGRAGSAGLRVMDLPNACSNAVASGLAIRFGLHGVNLMLCNGATSGLDAVGWAASAIAAGRARRVLVAGTEPADPVVRHLAAGNDGGRLLDGAAALVLESADAAAERGRRPLATVTGRSRRRDVTAAAEQAGATEGTGLWLPPAGHPPGAPSPPHHAVLDLGRVLPPASGAFGVLQCVAATAWLAAGHPPGVPPTALAVAGGGPADDAAAAVLLTVAPPEATPEGEG
ncbi:beta-ketoacyl synthase N-terminal-like domain-containing protein [Streptomyces sp. NPDC053048]|uniref:beta-ketoacyl synthase N-terminal-like domain-containing protein n=1 Tax=Streptomyces sp. NPDC053048 TaxID=3365694 RepID=UPI0037D6EE01